MRLAWTVGTFVGLVCVFFGLGLLVNFPAALLALGVLIWITTILATHFAIKMRKGPEG